MGWYHVNRIGKGICLGDVDKIHYNEDFIAKHTPTKDEALKLKLRDIRDEELDGYETWPLYKKWMLTPPTIEIVGFLGGAARFIAKPCLKQRVMRFPTIRYGCSAQ